MRFCGNCGTQIEDNGLFCPECGTPVAKEETAAEAPVTQMPAQEAPAPEKPDEQSKPEKASKDKPKRSAKQAGRGIIEAIKAFAIPVLVILLVVGAISTALALALRPAPQLTTVSGQDTTYSDGVLQVSLQYGENALKFESSETARMELVLTNISEDILRNLELDMNFPESIRYLGTPEKLKVDVLSPGVSYRMSLPVQQQVPIDDNFSLSLTILIAAFVMAVVLLVVHIVLRCHHFKHAHRALAMLLVVALVLPLITPIVTAESETFELVYEDGNEFATGIVSAHSVKNTFYLGKGSSSGFSYTAQYSCEQRVVLDAALSEDQSELVLSWSALEGAKSYTVYSGYETTSMQEVDSTKNDEYTLTLPEDESVCFYRVVAETGMGEVYSNDLRVLVNHEGNVLADSDGDLISTDLEELFGTSTAMEDTDGDGLTDYDEIAVTFTDPVNYDSDLDGISDGEDDCDDDGLTNKTEIEQGTSPQNADTDQDGLSDGFEVQTSHSDPLKRDTDDDGLWDDTEYQLRTDPTQSDTDGDGTSDVSGTITATLRPTKESDIGLQATDTGRNLSATTVTDISDNTSFAKKEYVASPVVSVEVPESTTEAYVTLPITGTVTDDEIVVVVYNEEGNDFRVVEEAVVSDDRTYAIAPVTDTYVTPVENYADDSTAVAARRSTYCALYIGNWHMAFQAELTPDREGNVFFDVSFVIDESGSMEDSSKSTPNDPERYRVEAAKRFTHALIAGDRAAVIGFNDTARRKINFTEDMEAVRAAIDSIVGNAGGTALFNGLNEALAELTTNPDQSRGRFIIALTDGEDSVTAGNAYDVIIDTCTKNHIPIYTIGLGRNVNTAFLTKLATYTGGAYIHVDSADDLPEVFNRIESTAFYGVDTDGDGLADSVEQYGLRDATGSVYYTDANDRYSDDDDLSDGEEAGNVFREETVEDVTVAYYLMLTDPSKGDTDGDGVDDLDETLMKTLPWCSDTDGDGLSDGQELSLGFDPTDANADGDAYNDSLELLYANWAEITDQVLSVNADNVETMILSAVITSIMCRDPFTYDLSSVEKSAALLEGALLGDFGDMLAEKGILDSRYTSSMYYYLGGVIISFIPYANVVAAVRDAVACAVEGDIAGVLLNLVGVVPGTQAALKTVQAVCETISYAQDAGDAIAEYPSSVTARKAAAAPAMTYLLLRVFRAAEETFHLDFDMSALDEMIEEQVELGCRGLIKDNIHNWETFLYYMDVTPYKVSDALGITDSVQLSLSNLSTPAALTDAVRKAAGNHQPGVQYTTADSGACYKLVRAFDLENTEYQDSLVLQAALYDAVDRVATYTDPVHGDLERKLHIMVTDTIVSKEAYSVLSDIRSYAEGKGVALEATLYLTTDDTDYNSTLEDIEESKLDEAIIILPGIAGSELVAGEDFGGSLLTPVEKGDRIWVPDVATNLMSNSNLSNIGFSVLTQAIDSLNMLQLDENGSSLYHVLPKTVTPEDASVGAMNTGTEIYKALLEAFGPDDIDPDGKRDVVFFSYDWRKSVEKAANELQTYIQARGYKKVSFVCHSMGGIVCSTYLSKSEQNREKTEKVITIGTPYGGAPKATHVFETGAFLDEARIMLVDNAFMKIARNLPSVYELLPYNDSINGNGGYLTDAAGNTMNSDAVKAYLANSPFNLNDKMLENAIALQSKLYQSGTHVMNREDIDCTIIAGVNKDTVTRLTTNGEKITSVGYSKAGDGTVPLVSAIESGGTLFDNPIYLVNGVAHSDLFGDEQVIALVTSLLDEEDGVVVGDKISQVDNTLGQSAKVFNSEVVKTEQAQDTAGSKWGMVYDTVVAYCPVSLVLYDTQGNPVGKATSNGIQVEDPADYPLFQLMDGGETKQVIVPEGYAVKVEGEGVGEMDLMMATFNEMGEMMQKYMYNDIAVTDATAVDVAISNDHKATLKIDRDGDGTFDETLRAEDAEYQMYIPMKDTAADRSDKVWILVGISLAMVLTTAVTLVVWLLIEKKKRQQF